MQFHNPLCCLRRRLIHVGYFGPAGCVRLMILRILRLSDWRLIRPVAFSACFVMRHWPPLGVAPQNPGEGRTPRCRHILYSAHSMKSVILAAPDREWFVPVPVHALAARGTDEEAFMATVRLDLKRRANLLAR